MVDAHFHLWRRADVKQAGVLAAPYLQRNVLWRDFVAAWQGQPIEQVIAVQVNDFVDGAAEARYLAREADPERLGALVAWAQLESPDVGAELQRLQGIPGVRGVRRTCQIEVDPAFCARPGYVHGVRLLGELGLVCDVCVRLEQVVAVSRLARACPETTVVLEHIGKPDLSQAPAGLLAAGDRGPGQRAQHRSQAFRHGARARRPTPDSRCGGPVRAASG